MSILRLWRRFCNLSQRRRILLIEAGFWLVTARLAILLFPFPWIARHIGRLHEPDNSPALQGKDQAAQEISWAIDRSALLLPVKLVCLPRALAAWQMLHRRGIPARVHFGASHDSDRNLSTHAWVDACGIEVTGYPEAYHCVEIGFFAR